VGLHPSPEGVSLERFADDRLGQQAELEQGEGFSQQPERVRRGLELRFIAG